jgi:hypothetical protein
LSRRVTGEPAAFLPGYGPQVAPFTSASPFGAVSGLESADAFFTRWDYRAWD